MRSSLARTTLLCVSFAPTLLSAQSWVDALEAELAASPPPSALEVPAPEPVDFPAGLAHVTNRAPTATRAEPEEPEALRTRTRGSLDEGRDADDGVFDRGDANADGATDVSDALYVLRFLLSGGDEPPCEKAADVNDDGSIDISDALALLGARFLGRGPLPAPYGMCGRDPSPDTLSCKKSGANCRQE